MRSRFSRRDCARGLHRTFCPPRKQRAQGRPGARCTRGLVCKLHKKNAHEHTGSAETLRPSLRNGFTAYFVLSPVTGFLATVAPEKLASHELDASIGASGPHDFAVRISARSSVAASASTASHRTFVTIASRPSYRVRRAELIAADLPDGLSGIFLREGLDRFLVICPTGGLTHSY